jgi:signal transduction histidine kinase
MKYLIILLFFATSLIAENSSIEIIDDTTMAVGNYSIYTDPSGTSVIDQVIKNKEKLFRPLLLTDLGTHNGDVWLKFSLVSRLKERVTLVYEIDHAVIEKAEAYITNGRKVLNLQLSGKYIHKSARSVLHNTPAFKNTLTIVAYGLMSLSLNGLSTIYLYPDSIWIEKHISTNAIGLLLVTYILFGQAFSDFKHNIPNNYKLSQFLIGVLILVPLIQLFDHGLYFQTLMIATLVVITWIVVCMIYLAFRKHIRSAKFWLGSQAIFMGATTLLVLQNSGVINLDVQMGLFVDYAKLIELLLLSLGLADRINYQYKMIQSQRKELLEKERIELQLVRANELIIQKEKDATIGKMLAEIVHEIKNITLNADNTTDSAERKKLDDLMAQTNIEDRTWKSLRNPLFNEATNIFDRDEELDKHFVIDSDSPNSRLYKVIRNKLKLLKASSEDILAFWKNLQTVPEIDLKIIDTTLTIGSYISLSDRTSHRIHELVMNLLNFSRIQNYTKTHSEVEEAVSCCLNIIGKKLFRSAIKVSTEISKHQSVIVDPGELNQVLMNIFNNAIDALNEKSEKHEKTITISSHEENETVFIEIENNGGEIPSQIMSKIFENNFSTKGNKGNGIGLYLCKKIIEDSSGKISVTCSDGKTTFSLELPKYIDRKSDTQEVSKEPETTV